jgi:SAM-dependent methyltransferase
MKRIDPALLEDYDHYPRIEEPFQFALDESLNPRGPELLFETVSGLNLPRKADVLDLGCGEGRFSFELAKRFGFSVVGVDPVPRHIEICTSRRDEASESMLKDLLRFEPGAAEEIPLPDTTVDLIWCREILTLLEDLETAFVECRRVLRPGGRMLIYQNVATERLEPREAELLDDVAGTTAERIEAAFTTAGFETELSIDLGSEIGEQIEEQTGEASRRLRHTARLLREPERYITEYGRRMYDIMLGDCLWHVYRMIGKLSGRLYLIRVRT